MLNGILPGTLTAPEANTFKNFHIFGCINTFRDFPGFSRRFFSNYSSHLSIKFPQYFCVANPRTKCYTNSSKSFNAIFLSNFLRESRDYFEKSYRNFSKNFQHQPITLAELVGRTSLSSGLVTILEPVTKY